MAGHSKWANIQQRKGRQDAARSKLFSKLSKEITVAAKMGDPDPDKNPRLRLAVKEAKSNSVPKDVIDRAIKKSVAGEGDDYEQGSTITCPADLCSRRDRYRTRSQRAGGCAGNRRRGYRRTARGRGSRGRR